jgi:hypothetical protein
MEPQNRPVWYSQTRFIRAKKNHSWTEHEINQVYTLRIQKVPIDKIIKILGLKVKRVQVYNILRMLRKNKKSKCFQCGSDLTNKECTLQENRIFKKCSHCQEKNSLYKRSKRNENLKQDKCGCCGNHPVLIGKKTCVYCLSYTHRHRIAEGFCGFCGKNPISLKSTALCDSCLETNRNNIKKHRDKHSIERKELLNANC